MSDIKKLLESLDAMEGPMGAMPAPMPMKDEGNPVTMNVSLNASGKEHVEDLINMMKNAGMDAKPVQPDMMPMRMDMERLRDIVGEPDHEHEDLEMEEAPCEDCGETPCCCDEQDEAYDNEPDIDYKDQHYMTKDLAGGINREKKAYKKAQDGDNAMAVETIKAELMKALAEKKKPDADGDGVQTGQTRSQVKTTTKVRKKVASLKKAKYLRSSRKNKTTPRLINRHFGAYFFG